MRLLILLSIIAANAVGQTVDRTEQALGWRVALDDALPLTQTINAAVSLRSPWVLLTTAHVPLDATPEHVAAVRRQLDQQKLVAAAYRVRATDSLSKAIEVAGRLGAEILIVPQGAQIDSSLESLAARNNIRVALEPDSTRPDVPRLLDAVKRHGAHFAVWSNPAAWDSAGSRTPALLPALKGRLAGGFLEPGTASDETLKEAYRLDLKPLLWTMRARDSQRTLNTVAGLVAYQANYAGRTQGVRRLGEITAEERRRVEEASPVTAPAVPKKPRKLLVFDLNVGRPGHPSIPYANLAMQIIGTKTKAFTATVSSDPAMLQPERLREFDAVYLNNTIGDIFSSKQARDAFASFIANGGGLVANHAVTVTETGWDEFGEILGARGASHRMTDEKVLLTVEDPSSPLTAVFGSTPFFYSDEIFRYQKPYSRDKVHVLLSVDSTNTDMTQGRCFGTCLRDDNDYPVAWIRQYGKGRVFYTTLGHNAYVFWDAKMLQFFLAAVQYALGDLSADATPRPQPGTNWDTLLSQVARYEWGQDRKYVRELDRAIGMLGASNGAAREAEKKLLNMLGGNATLAAKDAVCRQLAIIGSAESVPVLASMLSKKETSDMARYALEGIDSPQASKALRDALSSADAAIQPGIIHSLGRRHDPAAVAQLSALIVSSNAAVSAAAVNALGMIGTVEAENALLKAKSTPAVDNALLTVAEGAGPGRAPAIYSRLSTKGTLEEVRAAAVHGLARQSGNDTQATLVKTLQDPSNQVRRAAILELVRVAPQALITAMPRLQPAEKVTVLSSLAARGDKSVLPLFLDTIRKDSGSVRATALEGLAEVGTAAQVPLLVEAASRSHDQEQIAARYALARLPGADVEAAIAGAFSQADSKAKLELIRTGATRGSNTIAPALLQTAAGSDAGLRKESLRALRDVAGPEQVPGLLDLVLKASEDDRADGEQALAAAIRRAGAPDVTPVLAAYRKQTGGAAQASLISVAALTSVKEALPMLREAMQSSNAEVQRAAVNGLSQWATPDPMDDLLSVARNSSDASLKVLALRGYVRLVQLPVGRAPADSAKLLGTGMQLASRPEEKKAILAAAQRIVCPESLELARAAENDPAVAAEAKTAVAALTRALAARGN